MTESEMLELAAKAAGMPKHLDGMGFEMAHHPKWNPLTDDGDALRLAVKLRIDLIFMLSDENEGETIVYVGEDMKNESIRASLKDDPYAATRLAITRAAAEIGRNNLRKFAG